MKTRTVLAHCLAVSLTAALSFPVHAQGVAPDTAAIRAQIESQDQIIGRAIATRDFATLEKYWSPDMLVNSPANEITGRARVIESMKHGGLNYTSLKGTIESFSVVNDVAIEMQRENVVTASGPLAGKPLVRRSTNVWQKSGDIWIQVARQATYIGFDGAMLPAPVASKYTPPTSPEIEAIHAQIDANGQAVGHAIHTNDFAALEKLWSPSLVVNSPGNRILTREGVFEAMREDKLKYTSGKVFLDAFFASNGVAIQMGHEELVMANGPMAGQPLKRRYTDVWQKTPDGWVMIARQATYIGIDGGAVYGHPDPTLSHL